jgi:hypothetical protein
VKLVQGEGATVMGEDNGKAQGFFASERIGRGAHEFNTNQARFYLWFQMSEGVSFSMTKTTEVKGLTYEIWGLIFLLGATIWQVFGSDWFEKQLSKSGVYTQETANVATLTLIEMLTKQIAAPTDAGRHEIGQEIAIKANNLKGQLFAERAQTESFERGQVSVAKSIRLSLAAIGGVLIVLGKCVVMRHKSRQA